MSNESADIGNYNLGFADAKEEAQEIIAELIQLAKDGMYCQGRGDELETMERVEARVKEIESIWLGK